MKRTQKLSIGTFKTKLMVYATRAGEVSLALSYLRAHAPKLTEKTRIEVDGYVVKGLARKYGCEAHMSEGDKGILSGFTFEDPKARQALKRARSVIRMTEKRKANHVDPVERIAAALAKLNARDEGKAIKLAHRMRAKAIAEAAKSEE